MYVHLCGYIDGLKEYKHMTHCLVICCSTLLFAGLHFKVIFFINSKPRKYHNFKPNGETGEDNESRSKRRYPKSADDKKTIITKL